MSYTSCPRCSEGQLELSSCRRLLYSFCAVARDPGILALSSDRNSVSSTLHNAPAQNRLFYSSHKTGAGILVIFTMFGKFHLPQMQLIVQHAGVHAGPPHAFRGDPSRTSKYSWYMSPTWVCLQQTTKYFLLLSLFLQFKFCFQFVVRHKSYNWICS